MPLILVLLLAQAAPPPQGEDTAAIAATAPFVRMQGFACSNPKQAVPDVETSRPDQRSWILTCESGRYRVTFTGDTGATVVPLSHP